MSDLNAFFLKRHPEEPLELLDNAAAIAVDDDAVCVPLELLAAYANPLKSPPWRGHYPFSREIIAELIARNDLAAAPWDTAPPIHPKRPTEAAAPDRDLTVATQEEAEAGLYHARRVAFLVVNQDDNPIVLDVGVPGLFTPVHIVWDGNHRLAAALYRRDAEIIVSYSGSIELFNQMFPTARHI